MSSKIKGSIFGMGISGVKLGVNAWHPFFVVEIQDFLVFAEEQWRLAYISICKQLEAQHPLGGPLWVSGSWEPKVKPGSLEEGPGSPGFSSHVF